MEALVIAGTGSGVGKTTIATGLMAALAKQGCSVQGWKVGPDYIDPSYHALATGRPSRNLDTWMCSKGTVRKLFARSCTDVNVIEGVMGLFDGARGGRGSTAEVAKLLGVPVILVVDAGGMAQSAGAIVHGFASYDPKLQVAGVIFNRVAGEGHYEYLKESVRVPALGWVAREPSIALPERHLGLVPAGERKPNVENLAEVVARHLDLGLLRKLSRLAIPDRPAMKVRPANATIGYAWDEAYTFYYQDNLDQLRAEGAHLVPFSPLRDPALPEVDLLYFGGGFPEVFEEALRANTAMVRSVREWRKPLYAECGGLMYLSMAGAIPGQIRMTDRLQNFGYTEATALVDTPLLNAGETVRGHEFHYSAWDGPANAYRVRKRGKDRVEGYASGNILASYVHVHFASKPGLARRLVAVAKEGQVHGDVASNVARG
ncbi:MAG TPA: cobyrinate a,c-diamide synthase [Planctomycetota bacterium]|nr:cobyrinate a,c-diamide synthase [Planctomycetota bacterium]